MHLAVDSPPRQSREWDRFFHRFFKIRDLSSASFGSANNPEFCKIVVPPGLTVPRASRACSSHFRCRFTFDDLHLDGLRHSRQPEESYSVTVRNIRDAEDPVLPHFNAGSKPFITLLERLILELKYWSDSGLHLDVARETLCCGSVDAAGLVPALDWNEGLRLTWRAVDDVEGVSYTRFVYE
jgi:hypothetical protein